MLGGLLEGRTARELLRVSDDRSGQEKSNEQQHDENVDAWPFTFGEPYREVGSASRFARKARDEFPLLLDDLAGGRFGAEVLVMWEGSRGSRRVGEWDRLIDLCEQQGVLIAVTIHERIYDCSNAKDRKDLIADANDSEYASALTSKRVKRDQAAAAREGRPHGKIPYGYRRIYDETTRAFLRQEPHPDEAPVVRFIFSLYESGWGLDSIAGALNLLGIRTRPTTEHEHGQRWKYRRIADLLDVAAYAGLRVHRGEVVRDGTWPPLVDRETWDRVQARRQAQRVAASNQVRTARLCTGVARCARCRGTSPGAGRMVARRAKQPLRSGERPAKYQCRDCKRVSRDAVRLDAYVTTWVLAALKRPDVIELFAAGEEPAVTAARERVREARAELDEAMRLWNERKLSATAYAAMEQTLLGRIAQEERAIRHAVIPLAVDIPDPDQVDDWWLDVLTPEQRRQMVGALILEVVVHPVGKGRRRYNWPAVTEIEPRRRLVPVEEREER